MAKLSDAQKMRLVSDRVCGASYRALAKQYGISATQARNIVMEDPEFEQKCTQKKKENEAAILQHMKAQKGQVCNILDLLLDALGNPQKIADATLPQIATSLGILIDKYKMDEGSAQSGQPENNIFDVIGQTTGGELDTSGIPEIEPPAESGDDMVEQTRFCAL